MDAGVVKEKIPKISVLRRLRYKILQRGADTIHLTKCGISSTSWLVGILSSKFESLPVMQREKQTEEQIVNQSSFILRDYLKHVIEEIRKNSSNPMVTVSEMHPTGVKGTTYTDGPGTLVFTNTLEEKVDIIGGFLELNFPEASDVSKEIIKIGKELESRYPHLFLNVASNLRINVHSSNQILTTYTTVATELFRFEITWVKIVAFFVITANLFVECATDGQEQNTYCLVETFQKIMRRRLADWIIRHGGWIGLALHTQKHQISSLSLYVYSIFGVIIGLGISILPWTWSTYSVT